uniref:Peptidoglycan binding-like domain-containing protein n=1 Tax=Plectus sambesii TaxID=2011161 RepID=A0A914WQL0_9BILA
SKAIVGRYGILPKNIVSHADFDPRNKEDVSGYFDYKLFYSELNIYPGLFNSSLSSADQSKVLYQFSTNYSADVKTMQGQLRQYGFYLEVDGKFGPESQFAAEAFNRHYCPEVFKKETVDANGNMVRNASNQVWYALSNERLSVMIVNRQTEEKASEGKELS